MGQERAAILNVDENGDIKVPDQFKVKLKFSKSLYVSLDIDEAGNRFRMTLNRNIDEKFNLRNVKTNQVKQFDFSTGVIPIKQFITADLSNKVVVWFDEEKQALVFQCVLG